MKYKIGYIRDDGMVFFQYRKNYNKNHKEKPYYEHWLTKNAYNKVLLTKRDNANKYARSNKGMDKTRAWRNKNREYINRLQLNRRRNDDQYRIVCNLRKRISKFIHRKTKSTKELLGCTIEEFMGHLEKGFYGEMSWENYGKCWHVDHIKPITAFDLSKQSEINECFHYTNLQPLTAIDNIIKRNNYEEN